MSNNKWVNIGTITPPDSWSLPPGWAFWYRVRNASNGKVVIFYKFTGTVPNSDFASQYYWVKDKWKKWSAANTSLICEFYIKLDNSGMKLPGNYNIPGNSGNVAGVEFISNSGRGPALWFKQVK